MTRHDTGREHWRVAGAREREVNEREWRQGRDTDENDSSKAEPGWSQEVKRPVGATESGKNLNVFVQNKSNRITVRDEKRSCLNPKLIGRCKRRRSSVMKMRSTS